MQMQCPCPLGSNAAHTAWTAFAAGDGEDDSSIGCDAALERTERWARGVAFERRACMSRRAWVVSGGDEVDVDVHTMAPVVKGTE